MAPPSWDPLEFVLGTPLVTVTPLSVSEAPESTAKARSMEVASIVVELAPAPVIWTGLAVVMSRSPVVASSAAADGVVS